MEEKKAKKAVRKTLVTEDEKTWATFVHLSAFIQVVVPFLGGVAGPLIIWLIKRKELPFVDDQGKEAVNFNISVLLYGIISSFFMIMMIGFLLLALLGAFWIIFVIVAGVKANRGERYRYPLTIRFIR